MLHSNTHVFLYTYYIDVTPVTGKNIKVTQQVTQYMKLSILETCAFSFLYFPFNQTETQQRVAGYS